MAIVHLRNNWFGPNGHLYEKGKQDPRAAKFEKVGVEIPDEFVEFLPHTAEVLSGPPPKPTVVPETPASLREHDHTRAASDDAERFRQGEPKKGTLTLKDNADRIRAQLAAEGKTGK